jgi:hypothetical protein
MELLPDTVFVSHTSSDDVLIRTHILTVVSEIYWDPFFHSWKTGGAEAYEKIVGLSLLSSHRILSIWSENAAKSDYFLAEQHLAISESKSTVAFCIDAGLSFHNRMLSKELTRHEVGVIDASTNIASALQQLREVLPSWQP